MTVKLSIDNLSEKWPTSLKDKKVGALLHPASVGADLKHSIEKIKALDGKIFNLTTLFGPQHGIEGHTQDNMIEWESKETSEYGVPVYSLYGENRKPTLEMFENLDVLIVDLQDVGARYYTFIWSMYLCMEAAQEQNKTIVVLDRPNPIGNKIEGPILELDHASFVGLHSIPVRHGKTIGQLAKQFKKECFPKLDLYVLEMENYNPEMFFNETGLPWVFPSPNMPTLETAVIYPGMCLLEATNVSEGRGTTKPFELFGAPFIDSKKFCQHMNSLNLPGVYFREAHFQPSFHKWQNEFCNGAQIHILNQKKCEPFQMGIEILKFLFNTYPNDFKWRTKAYEYEYEKLAIDILLGNGWFRKKHIELA